MYQSITEITLKGGQCISITQGGIIPPPELKTFMGLCVLMIILFFAFIITDLVRSKKRIEKKLEADMEDRISELEENIRRLKKRVIEG